MAPDMTDNFPAMAPSAEERANKIIPPAHDSYGRLTDRLGLTVEGALLLAFHDGVLAERARTDEAGKLIQEAAALLPGRDEEIRKKERARLLAALREPHLSWRSGKACADWLEKHDG